MVAREIDDKASDTLVVGLRLMVLDEEFDSPPSPPNSLISIASSLLLPAQPPSRQWSLRSLHMTWVDTRAGPACEQVVDTDDANGKAPNCCRPPGETRPDTRIQMGIT